MLALVEGGKPENPEENSRGRNKQQTYSIYDDVGSRIRPASDFITAPPLLSVEGLVTYIDVTPLWQDPFTRTNKFKIHAGYKFLAKTTTCVRAGGLAAA